MNHMIANEEFTLNVSAKECLHLLNIMTAAPSVVMNINLFQSMLCFFKCLFSFSNICSSVVLLQENDTTKIFRERAIFKINVFTIANKFGNIVTLSSFVNLY